MDGAARIVENSNLSDVDKVRLQASLGRPGGSPRAHAKALRAFNQSGTDAEHERFENVSGAQ
jgi:hypothetical protein